MAQVGLTTGVKGKTFIVQVFLKVLIKFTSDVIKIN